MSSSTPRAELRGNIRGSNKNLDSRRSLSRNAIRGGNDRGNMEEKSQKIIYDISWSAILKVAVVILAVIFLYLVKHLVIIFIVALILATLINPLADMFARRRIPRALAVLLIYIGLIGFLAFTITLLVPPLIEESGQLIKNSSGYVEEFIGKISYLRESEWSKNLIGDSDVGAGTLQANFPKALSGVFETVTGFFGGIVTLILILVLAFYMVVEEGALKKFFRDISPASYQPHLVGLVTRAQNKIGLWLRGSLVLGIVVGVLVYIGLTILGVKYALVLAILAGTLELIPYIGPPTSAVPAVFLAFAQEPIKGLFVLIMYILIQQLENHILVPKIMKTVVGINPIVSIMSLGVGFSVAGILGALLAIPTATAFSVFVTDFIELKKKKAVSDGKS